MRVGVIYLCKELFEENLFTFQKHWVSSAFSIVSVAGFLVHAVLFLTYFPPPSAPHPRAPLHTRELNK